MLRGAGEDVSARPGAQVEFGLDRIQDDWSTLVLVDTHQLITGKQRCRIGLDRAEGGWIVKIEDPAAVMCCDLAQQRGLTNRPWPLEENDGFVSHVLKGDGQDAALPQCRLPTVHRLTVACNAISRGHSMRFSEGFIRGKSRVNSGTNSRVIARTSR